MALATLLIVVLAALMPLLVTLGPPVIVKPVLSNLLFPVVTVVNVGVALVATEYDIEPSAAVVGVTTIFQPPVTLR